jgi:hypothetical protein
MKRITRKCGFGGVCNLDKRLIIWDKKNTFHKYWNTQINPHIQTNLLTHYETRKHSNKPAHTYAQTRTHTHANPYTRIQTNPHVHPSYEINSCLLKLIPQSHLYTSAKVYRNKGKKRGEKKIIYREKRE